MTVIETLIDLELNHIKLGDEYDEAIIGWSYADTEGWAFIHYDYQSMINILYDTLDAVDDIDMVIECVENLFDEEEIVESENMWPKIIHVGFSDDV